MNFHRSFEIGIVGEWSVGLGRMLNIIFLLNPLLIEAMRLKSSQPQDRQSENEENSVLKLDFLIAKSFSSEAQISVRKRTFPLSWKSMCGFNKVSYFENGKI